LLRLSPKNSDTVIHGANLTLARIQAQAAIRPTAIELEIPEQAAAAA
jgi:hypothetical protein